MFQQLLRPSLAGFNEPAQDPERNDLYSGDCRVERIIETPPVRWNHLLRLNNLFPAFLADENASIDIRFRLERRQFIDIELYAVFVAQLAMRT